MNYIDIETFEYGLTEYQIKQANPQTSFPKPFKSERYKPVVGMPQPAFDAITQRVEELPPTDKGTHWEQTWNVVAMDSATIAANQASAKQRHNDTIWATIKQIENDNLFPRPLRDMVIRGNHEAKAKAQEIDDQIAALKAQLQ